MHTDIKSNTKLVNHSLLIFIAFLGGLLCGYLNISHINYLANFTTKVFISLLKLISIPIIFFSITSTLASMSNIQETKALAKKVISYTLLTTMISATVGLFLFIIINPTSLALFTKNADDITKSYSYLEYISKIVPSNIVQPFYENNVIGALCLALAFGFALLITNEENKKNGRKSCLFEFFPDIFAVITKITSWIIKILPIGIWGFSVLFMQELNQELSFGCLFLYLTCIVLSNIVQGIIILPTFLTFFRISPIRLFKAMFPALIMAFFTKSSAATLPLALKCAQENAGISSKVAKFTFPLCTAVNMNACAAFILVTVMFVMKSYGINVTPLEMIVWVGIATIAAFGNAGIPMGCYFLTSSLLVAMNYPLTIMGIILPFYTIIDMLETALNIWSDSCVAAIVDKTVNKKTVD